MVHLEEFMNYICASTLDEKVFSVHSFYPVGCKLVLSGCTILRGSEVFEMLLEFYVLHDMK